VAILGPVFAIVGPGGIGLLKGGASLYLIGGDFPIDDYAFTTPTGPLVAPPFGGPDEFLDTALGEFRLTALIGDATFQVSPTGVRSRAPQAWCCSQPRPFWLPGNGVDDNRVI
jgi:hypothetical protein